MTPLNHHPRNLNFLILDFLDIKADKGTPTGFWSYMKNHPKKLSIGIIGAGFGGISAAKKLAHQKNFEITLIDRRNHHLFQPLLYQVAMAGLNPSEIAIPIRKLFSKHKNINVVLAEVEDIELSSCRVQYDQKWHSFDTLIVACGAKHFYFGKNEWEEIAPGLKNIEQATEIRRRVLTAFEMAEKQEDDKLKQAFLSFAIVGGGPTGVELAGAISEMAKKTLINDYNHADLSHTKVYLIEAGSRILPAFPEQQSLRAEKDLNSLGVEVIKNTRADELSKNGLKVGSRWIDCKTILWAAGVKPGSLTEKINTEKDSQGRIMINSDLSLKNHPHVFAIGDIACCKAEDGEFLPGIAPVAIQQGEYVGQLILDRYHGKPETPFKYWDKGIMATIGRSKAVVSSGKLQLSGFLAWITWVFIHIVYLMRFKNKVFVFLQWIWSYFNFGRGARLIVHKNWKFYSGEKINYD